MSTKKEQKKLKEREKEKELENHCKYSREELRRKKKMEKNGPIKKKTKTTLLQRFFFSLYSKIPLNWGMWVFFFSS